MEKNYTFSGHDVVELAKEYGTPLYVMSQDIIEKNIDDIVNAFKEAGAAFEVNFAGKAFLNEGMCRIIDQKGISLDVASGGELFTALKSGIDPEKITFHGSNKSKDEMKMAIDAKVGRVVIDSAYELDCFTELMENRSEVLKVMFRISPGIEAHTHELIQTGKIDSKFGLALSQAQEIILRTKDIKNIETVGIHCHIGSQIVDEEPFVLAAKIMLDLFGDLNNAGLALTELNLGGGFGIPYLKEDPMFDVKHYIPVMVKRIQGLCEEKKMKMPKIMVEPGRYIAATAGITLYTVGTVKDIPGIKKYVSVDGGLGDNPRPALYGALYEGVIANKKATEKMEKVTVSGKCCETDTLIPGIELNQPESGDILAVFNTGAYNYSMASNYNRLPRPGVVLLKGEASALLVKRETYEEICENDCMPGWLKNV
ncbi:MAG: diaminopimelate decarboxylase [Eubacteriaceae bacterium]